MSKLDREGEGEPVTREERIAKRRVPYYQLFRHSYPCLLVPVSTKWLHSTTMTSCIPSSPTALGGRYTERDNCYPSPLERDRKALTPPSLCTYPKKWNEMHSRFALSPVLHCMLCR